MGIRIVSKSAKLTLRDLSQFLYLLDNIYKAELFLKTERKYAVPYFYRQKLKDSESLYIARIEEKSPLHLIIVSSLPYKDISHILVEIIKIAIALKVGKYAGRRIERPRQDRELRRSFVRRELEYRRLAHDDLIVEEIVKMSYSRVDIEEVDIDSKTFEDYFN